MSVRGKHLPYVYVALALLFGVRFMQSLQLRGSVKKVVDKILNYFPHENCFCVVLIAATSAEELLPMPTLHEPAVIVTQDRLLQDWEEIDGSGWVHLHDFELCEIGGTDCSTLGMFQPIRFKAKY